MVDFRSKSYNNDGRFQTEPSHGRPSTTRPNDFRSYSVSYSAGQPKKAKSTKRSTSKSWSFNDPEFQRKRRVAGYKAYSVEGKVKGSLRRSFRWLKVICTRVVYR